MTAPQTHEDMIAEARKMGRDAGIAAGSWAADGNTSAEHARNVLAMMAEGDPQSDDYLPARPDLSGQWAGDPTPASIAADILGQSADELYPLTQAVEIVDALAQAWEEGRDETFSEECERTLRAILPDDDTND